MSVAPLLWLVISQVTYYELIFCLPRTTEVVSVLTALSCNCGLCSFAEEPNNEQKAKCDSPYGFILTMRLGGWEYLACIFHPLTKRTKVHTLPMFLHTGVLSDWLLESMNGWGFMIKLSFRLEGDLRLQAKANKCKIWDWVQSHSSIDFKNKCLAEQWCMDGNSRIWETEEVRSLWVQGQPSLQSKF